MVPYHSLPNRTSKWNLKSLPRTLSSLLLRTVPTACHIFIPHMWHVCLSLSFMSSFLHVFYLSSQASVSSTSFPYAPLLNNEWMLPLGAACRVKPVGFWDISAGLKSFMFQIWVRFDQSRVRTCWYHEKLSTITLDLSDNESRKLSHEYSKRIVSVNLSHMMGQLKVWENI